MCLVVTSGLLVLDLIVHASLLRLVHRSLPHALPGSVLLLAPLDLFGGVDLSLVTQLVPPRLAHVRLLPQLNL